MPNIEIENLPFYPATYDPETQRPQWFSQVPNAVIIDPNFRWVMPRGESDLEDLVKLGVTNFKRGHLAQPGWTEPQIVAFRDRGFGYDDVPQTQHFLGLPDRGPGASEWVGIPGQPWVWPQIWNRRFFPTAPGATEPMPAAEGRTRGALYTTEYTLVVFENSEQDHAISGHWPFIREFSEEWNARVVARWPGKKTLRAWNYFTSLGHSILYSTAAERLSFLNSPVSSWPANIMLPGGNLASYNAVCSGIYLRDPQSAQTAAYNVAYECYIAKKAEKENIVFMQPAHEWLPNNNVEWRVSGGKHYYQGKLRIAPGIGYAIQLFARLWGSAFVDFGFGGKESRPFKQDPMWHPGQGIWVPDGNPETVPGNLNDSPVWGPPGSTQEVFVASGQEDYAGFVRWAWERSFGKVMGAWTESWPTFRVDGGSWRSFGSQLCEGLVKGFYGDGYTVYARKLGTKVAFMVYNGKMPDSQRHKVEWQFEGETFEAWVSGTIPYCFYHEF